MVNGNAKERKETTSSNGFVLNKKRVRSLASNLPGTFLNKKLLLAVNYDVNVATAQKIGFNDKPVTGDTVLPKATGPIGRFNAYGREKILRDQEKESFERTFAWTHEEWAGRGETKTVTTTVTHTYYRFPRELIDPPLLELVIRDSGKQVITMQNAIRYDSSNPEELTHAINVFLELFGYVEIFDEDLSPMPDPKVIRRLNWHVLPKGKKISEADLKNVLSKSKRIRPVEFGRQEKIAGYKPDETAVGIAGFDGYIIYVFHSKGFAVLESLRYGNASYIISSGDWETLSKMTKQQLLSNNLVQLREIHNSGWDIRIDKILTEKK